VCPPTALATRTYDDLGQDTVLLRLDIHLRLVCFNLEEDIARGKGVAYPNQPAPIQQLFDLADLSGSRRGSLPNVTLPSLIFHVAMLPSVMVGESAGMVKCCAASEAWPAWSAGRGRQSDGLLVPPSSARGRLTSARAIVAELLGRSACRRPTSHGEGSHGREWAGGSEAGGCGNVEGSRSRRLGRIAMDIFVCHGHHHAHTSSYYAPGKALQHMAMPAVSRGLDGFLRQQTLRLPSSLRVALFGARQAGSQPASLRHARSFTSSLLRTYQYPARRPPPPNAGHFIGQDPVLRQVTQTRLPVTLYTAPRNKWYYWKVYGTAALWIGVGAFSIKFNYDIKENGLPFFVRPTYIAVGLAFIAIGCYISTAPVNRMRMLEVIPGFQGGPITLRMAVRPAPWAKEQTLFASLGQVSISEKTEPLVRELAEAERARRQRVWVDMDELSLLGRVWEGSSRWVHQKWISFFLRFKFAVLRFGIAEVEVQGQKWKIDCSGWLMEDGRAIDRLILER